MPIELKNNSNGKRLSFKRTKNGKNTRYNLVLDSSSKNVQKVRINNGNVPREYVISNIVNSLKKDGNVKNMVQTMANTAHVPIPSQTTLLPPPSPPKLGKTPKKFIMPNNYTQNSKINGGKRRTMRRKYTKRR